jgi:hypothetical protein
MGDEEEKEEADPAADEDEDIQEEDEEDVDEEEGESEDPLKSLKAFKKLVVSTLEKNEMSDKRACKMEIIDFLNLLKIMNDNGIHFK